VVRDDACAASNTQQDLFAAAQASSRTTGSKGTKQR